LKILYLSCHSILEYDELRIFRELGYEVFSPGAYWHPATGGGGMRPPMPDLQYDPEMVEMWQKLEEARPGQDGKTYITREIADKFDVIIAMHVPKYITENWVNIRHKRVIWRTIGQSVASTENTMRPYRERGMQVVRYSPMEANIPGFIGQDAFIRFGKDPAEYGPWTGEKERVVTFCQSMQIRDAACNYTFFEDVTRPFNRVLYGPGNDGIPFWGGKLEYDDLRKEMNSNRVYFYTGTHPASYTLNFMEAWMCFPEETLVSSDTEIEDVLIKEYKGDLLTIVTEDGQSVSCTPTHPFLTQRGFVEAQNLGILDSIYQYQEANCDSVDKRRIGDIARELQKTDERIDAFAPEQELLVNNDEVQNRGFKTPELDYFQTSGIFYDAMRDLLLSRHHRWGGDAVLQGGQKTQKNSPDFADNKYRSMFNEVAWEEIRDSQPGDFKEVERVFSETKSKFRILVEGLKDVELVGGIASLSLDKKRAMWNFDWFHQEQIESEVQDSLLSIRNRLLDQDKNIKPKRIKSVTRKPFQGRVYNLSTKDGVYRAEGFIVHNSGIPIVAIGPEKGNASYFAGHNLYEIPRLITNGVDGFVSDSKEELRMYIQLLLNDQEFARQIGQKGRESAIHHFDKDMIKYAWKAFLESKI